MAISWKRQRGGLMAKKLGAAFEQTLIHYCASEPDTSIIRIYDGAIRVSATKLIPQRQPFDFIIGYKNSVIFCDAKSAKESCYTLNEDKIFYQLGELGKLSKHNQKAGYLVQYRGVDEFRWFGIDLIRRILTIRKSLVPNDGVLVGHGLPLQIDFQKILDSDSP